MKKDQKFWEFVLEEGVFFILKDIFTKPENRDDKILARSQRRLAAPASTRAI